MTRGSAWMRLRRLLHLEADVVIDLTDERPEFLLAVQRLDEKLPSQRDPQDDPAWLEYRG